MLAPQACVAVEIAGPTAADEPRVALERRCSEILGAGRCRIVLPDDVAAGCWRARVTPAADATPEASVVLSDPTEPAREPVRRDLTFRANDAPGERWATLGLVIAALVTVEEHSAAEEVQSGPIEGGGFAPVVEAPAPAPARFVPSGALAAAAVATVGALPRPAIGGRLELVFGGERVGGTARGTIFPASSRATVGAAGGDFDQWSVGAGLCGLAARGPWRARLCVGADLARTHARGFGVAETNAASAWWEAAWLGAAAERRLGAHLALVAAAEGAAHLRRPTFAIEGAQASVFTPAPASATVSLGLAVPFP
jgi:hypothetical protein